MNEHFTWQQKTAGIAVFALCLLLVSFPVISPTHAGRVLFAGLLGIIGITIITLH